MLGELHAMFDEANQVLVCRWQDKKEVTVLSNSDQVFPTHIHNGGKNNPMAHHYTMFTSRV